MDITKSKEDDVSCMKKIEYLSKKISDLIMLDKYEQVSILDRERLNLIKQFKNIDNKQFRIIVSNINDNILKDKKNIETKLNSLKSDRTKFIKRFKAYNY